MNGSPCTDGAEGGSCDNSSRILYCHCAYAKVVPEEVKAQVLTELSASGVAFDAVSDLCEMSARRDPAMSRLADPGPLKIAACFPRAVKWLFHSCATPLPADGVEILNMREQSAEEVVSRLLATADDRASEASP